MAKRRISQRIQFLLLKSIEEMHADTSSVDFEMARIWAKKEKEKQEESVIVRSYVIVGPIYY